MPYLDQFLNARNERLRVQHKAKPKPIIKGDRRTHVINKVMDVLSDWRLSHFENEGACRAGLRSSLCLGGNSWTASDLDAANLVAECLLLMGAERPTWDQGQPEYLIAYDECRSCRGPLPLDEIEGSRKGMFCSKECATSWLTRRDFVFAGKQSKIQEAAQAVLKRESRPLRICEGCSAEYRPYSRIVEDQRYCSHKCYALARQTIPERPCPQCNKSFRPVTNSQIHCSRACAYQRAVDRYCPGCESPFTARSMKAVYCSDRCRARVKKLASRPDGYLAGKIRTYHCLHCSEAFETNSDKKRYCSQKCNGAAERLRMKARRQRSNVVPFVPMHMLTAEVFDGWFRRAA